jgi:hypothetical protein
MLDKICPRYPFIDCREVCPDNSNDPKCLNIYRKPCTVDTECRIGWKCDTDKICKFIQRPTGCNNNGDCFPNICVNRECVKGCTGDGDCKVPPKIQCNLTTKICEEKKKCVNDGGCSANEFCDPNGECVRKPNSQCQAQRDCSSNFICSNGKCSDCGFWYYEQDNTCHPSLWKMIGIPLGTVMLIFIVLIIILILVNLILRRL